LNIDQMNTYRDAEDAYARAVARLDWPEARVQALAAINSCPIVSHLPVWTERLSDVTSKQKAANRTGLQKLFAFALGGR